MPILEATEPGLGESSQLNAVGGGAGMLIDCTGGMCRGRDVALRCICDGTGELVDDDMLVGILRSNIAFSIGVAEI